MKDLEKLMAKSGNSKMTPEQKKAKMDVIMELMEMAKEMMSDNVHKGMSDLKSAQKVSVMAPDAESLEEGLDVAKEIVGAQGEDSEESKEETLEEVVAAAAEDMPPMVDSGDEEVEVKAKDEDEEDEDSAFGKPKKSIKKKTFNMFDDED
jgi:hypothetical protein